MGEKADEVRVGSLEKKEETGRRVQMIVIRPSNTPPVMVLFKIISFRSLDWQFTIYINNV